MDDLEERIANRVHDAPLPTEYMLDEALDRLRTYREALECVIEAFEGSDYGSAAHCNSIEQARKALKG